MNDKLIGTENNIVFYEDEIQKLKLGYLMMMYG